MHPQMLALSGHGDKGLHLAGAAAVFAYLGLLLPTCLGILVVCGTGLLSLRKGLEYSRILDSFTAQLNTNLGVWEEGHQLRNCFHKILL